MISASRVEYANILGRLRGGRGRETVVASADSAILDSVTKSNT